MAGAQQVAADRPGGVAVAGVVDGEQEGGLDRRAELPVLGAGQRGVDGDGQRLLRDPAAAEGLDLLRRRRPVGGEVDRPAQSGGRLLVAGVAGEQFHAAPDRVRQGLTGDEVADHGGEGAGGEVAGRVAVGDLRAAGGEFERRLRVAFGEAERSGAHHRAAPLRRRVHRAGCAVDRAARVRCVALAQAGQAGQAGSPPLVEPGLLAQPTPAVRDAVLGRRPVVVLGVQPAEVRLLHQGDFGSADPLRLRPGVAAQPAFCGEQGHLGVVADPADRTRTVPGRLGQAGLAELGPDRAQRHAFDRVAESVPDRPAEQTAAYPRTVGGQLLPRQIPHREVPPRSINRPTGYRPRPVRPKSAVVRPS